MGKYILNSETLMYEFKEASFRHKVLKVLFLLAGSFALAFLYAWVLTSVLGVDLPKTRLLKMESTRWASRLDLLDSRLDRYESALEAFEVRDNDIYRSIFGMNEIPDEVRNAGTGGVDKYAFLDGPDADARLKNTLIRLDRLSRKACVQSKSFDEVAALSRKAGDMASCIPAIPPILPDPSQYTLTSPFGYRADPFNNTSKLHTGVDLAMRIGSPVYATGNGVVSAVAFDFFGYGNCVTIDHGFGYQTIYAHLNSISVREGMEIKRGDCIGESGKSGRASGPHLHYEVVYKGEKVNPANYFDLSIPKEDYAALISKREGESAAVLSRRSFTLRRRK